MRSKQRLRAGKVGGGKALEIVSGVASGLSSVNFPVECERILGLIKAGVPAHSTAT